MLFLQEWSTDHPKSCQGSFQYTFWIQRLLTVFAANHYFNCIFTLLNYFSSPSFHFPLPLFLIQPSECCFKNINQIKSVPQPQLKPSSDFQNLLE